MNLFEFVEEQPLTFSFSRLQQLIKDGFISKRKHPTENLWILNYTAKVQYEKVWTPETIMCRGLVVDDRWVIQARGWPKFFNWEEHTDEERTIRTRMLMKGQARFVEKMDGSLIIAFWYNGSWHFTTRGSFESEQAARAPFVVMGARWTEFAPNKDYTYLFEIIYPENRIVVDYGSTCDVYLLGVIDKGTGQEVLLKAPGPFPRPHVYTQDEVANSAWVKPNSEGVVVTFDDGWRCKMKTEEYKRLHKLLCGVTPKAIWQMLLDGEDPADLCEKVPDEFFQWVKSTERQLRHDYDTIFTQARDDLNKINALNLETRKEIAELVVQKKYPGIIFGMMDQKNYQAMIWRLIKPVGRAFRCADD